MEIKVFLKGKKDPIVYSGDRIDILNFTLNGVEYKQIRCFKNGFSKSELIDTKIINKLEEI
ncbi:hypothetical protein JCM1393_27040 [Clostridium carnis]